MPFAFSMISSTSISDSTLLSILSARDLIVGLVNNEVISIFTFVSLKIIEFNFINVKEENPSSYKSSVVPNLSVLAMDATSSTSFFSVSLSASTYSKFNFGFGSLLISVLPFGDIGISSSCMNTVGTIYSVNLFAKYLFKRFMSISSSAVK